MKAILQNLPICLLLFAGCSGSKDQSSDNRPKTPDKGKQSKVSKADESKSAKERQAKGSILLTKKGSASKQSESNNGYGKKKASKPFREPLFEGWVKPEFTLFFTGQQRGYLEPCGCTGLASQKGGLMRRDTFLRSLTQRGWNPIPLDVGNQVRRQVRQSEIKFQMTADALKKMNYRAIAFGAEDVQLSFGELAAAVDPEDKKSPFICANVHLLDSAPQFHIIQAGSRKIGVTAVMGDRFAKSIISDIIEVEPAEKALARVVKQLQEKRCDVMILLAQASLSETKELAKKFDKFDLVVTSGGAEEPAYEPSKIAGQNGLLIQIGGKGMYAGVVGYYPDGKQKFRYQRAPMDSRFKDSKRMHQLFVGYQDQLKRLYHEQLGIKPRRHPSGAKFVGSAACKDCHVSAYDVWKKSKHSHATQSLVKPRERAQIQRHYDPECLSCHVTGWNPQKYEPYVSGFLHLKKTPLVTGSGCENCHGPGSKHVAAESNDADAATRKRFQLSMRLPLKQAERKCMECHDLDNSPDFHVKGAFQRFWKKIAHGKDD